MTNQIYKLFYNNSKFKIEHNCVYVHYLCWRPFFQYSDDLVKIYFDRNLAKHILKYLPKLGENIYLISPLLSDPVYKKIDPVETHRLNLENMFSNYSYERFFNGFKDINFDFVDNVVKYATDNNCSDIMKVIYENINTKVQAKSWNWSTQKDMYNFPEEIRNTFNGLYREIRLSQILKYS